MSTVGKNFERVCDGGSSVVVDSNGRSRRDGYLSRQKKRKKRELRIFRQRQTCCGDGCNSASVEVQNERRVCSGSLLGHPLSRASSAKLSGPMKSSTRGRNTRSKGSASPTRCLLKVGVTGRGEGARQKKFPLDAPRRRRRRLRFARN